jgi:uncharacterized protein YhbP (UPF0306 family)
MRRHVKDEALAILAEAKDMTVATVCADGAPHATVVSFASDGLRLYFGCAPDSRKAQNLGAEGPAAATVTLPYKDWAQIRGLSLMGRARRLDGMDEIARVGELFFGKFPEVAQYVGEPSQAIRLYELTPSSLSLLDYRRGFGHTDRAEIEARDLAA